MSSSKEHIAEHRRQVLQGVLFLIDNPGEPVPDVTASRAEMRDFVDRVIASHLAKHTYYCQRNHRPTLEHRQVVDVDWMRRQLKEMYERAATPSTKSNLKLSEHIQTDKLFFTGTDGLAAEKLDKYDYNKSIFSEADLPAHENDEEDSVVSDSQSSSDAEVSEHKQESRAHSVSDHPNNHKKALDNSTVLNLFDEYHGASQLPERAQHQSTRASKTRALPSTPTGDPGQSTERAVEPQRLVQPRPKVRIVKSNARGPDTISGRPSTKSVSAGRERIEGNAEAFRTSTVLEKRERDTLEDRTPGERSSKVSRLSRVTSEIPKSESALPVAGTYDTANSKISACKAPPEDAAAVSDSDAGSLILLDTSVLKKELEKLSEATLRVVNEVFDCIGGHLVQYPTVLDPDVPQRLLDLYVRCWGEGWEQVRSRLTRDCLFTPLQVAMSLVSAFLYGNVLNQEALLLDDLIGLHGIASLGGHNEALCHFLQPEQCWSDLKASAHAFYTTQAHALLAQDEADIQHQLKKEAEELADSLLSIIAPHFRVIFWLARNYGQSSGQPEEAWIKVFKSGITDVILRTLHHRLRLRATGCEYVYTWPNTGEEFDFQSMESDRKGQDIDGRQEVLFTVFPGLEVTAPDGSGEKMYIEAVVKVNQVKQSPQ